MTEHAEGTERRREAREMWDARYAEADLVWSAEPNRFLVAEVQGLAPGRALDLGTGEGRNAVWLAEHGWRVTGVDFSDRGLDKARAMAARRNVSVDWVLADVVEHVPAAGEFDLVAVMYLHLSHDELSTVLTRAAAALAPGGTILVVGHDVANLEGGHGGPQRPEILYTPQGIASLLPDLVVERAERVERPVEVEGATRTAVDTLVRAHRPPA